MKIKKKMPISPRIILGVLAIPILAYLGVCTFKLSQAIIWDNRNDISVYEGDLPSRYNLKEHVAMVDHYQWPWGTCWSFATTRAIETYLELHNEGLELDLSRLHPVYMMSEDFGGPLDMTYPSSIASNFADYMERYNDRGFGEVLEAEVPYSNEIYTDSSGTYVISPYDIDDYDYLYNLKPTAFVTNVVNFSRPNAKFTDSDLELIKRHIMKNGSIYATTNEYSSFYDYEYHSSNGDSTRNRYYDGSLTDFQLPALINHGYAIIGWDDNYPKEKFTGSAQPSRDGAFITLNSTYGVDIDGSVDYSCQIGYTSYEDLLISYNAFGISGATTDLLSASQEVRISNHNLYVALKESPSLKKMIVDVDDDSQTLWLLKTFQDADIVTSLDLSNHRLDSIAGLDGLFPYLSTINLSHCTFEGDYISNIIRKIAWDNVDLSYTGISDQEVVVLNKSAISKLGLAGNRITSLAGLEGYGMEVDVSDNPITSRSLNLLHWSGSELGQLKIDNTLASNADVDSFCSTVTCTSLDEVVLSSGSNAGVSTVAIPDELYEKYRKDKYYPETTLNYDSSAITFDWRNRTITFTPASNRNYYIEFYSNRNENQRYLLQANINTDHAYAIVDGANQSYYKNGGTRPSFRGNGDIADFNGCLIDGNNINTAQYILSSNNTTLEFSPELLETLSDGTHTLTMVWNDGTASAEFTVATRIEFGGILTDNTGGNAEITPTSSNSFTVESDKACMALWTRDNGATWNRLSSTAVAENNNMREFSVEQTSGVEVVISVAGDVNNDKNVNVRDARKIVNSVMGKVTLSASEAKLADVDGKAGINVRDARAIVSYIMGKTALSW